MKSILDRVQALPALERARALCQFNDWIWPDAFDDLKPEGWDGLKDYSFNKSEPTKYNNPIQNEIRATLSAHCTDDEKKWYWENVWTKFSP